MVAEVTEEVAEEMVKKEGDCALKQCRQEGRERERDWNRLGVAGSEVVAFFALAWQTGKLSKAVIHAAEELTLLLRVVLRAVGMLLIKGHTGTVAGSR